MGSSTYGWSRFADTWRRKWAMRRTILIDIRNYHRKRETMMRYGIIRYSYRYVKSPSTKRIQVIQSMLQVFSLIFKITFDKEKWCYTKCASGILIHIWITWYIENAGCMTTSGILESMITLEFKYYLPNYENITTVIIRTTLTTIWLSR